MWTRRDGLTTARTSSDVFGVEVFVNERGGERTIFGVGSGVGVKGRRCSKTGVQECCLAGNLAVQERMRRVGARMSERLSGTQKVEGEAPG